VAIKTRKEKKKTDYVERRELRGGGYGLFINHYNIFACIKYT
jgi:hypothetical protein